jgi:hypothetical protein
MEFTRFVTVAGMMLKVELPFDVGDTKSSANAVGISAVEYVVPLRSPVTTLSEPFVPFTQEESQVCVVELGEEPAVAELLPELAELGTVPFNTVPARW